MTRYNSIIITKYNYSNEQTELPDVLTKNQYRMNQSYVIARGMGHVWLENIEIIFV